MIQAFYFRGMSTSGRDEIKWAKLKIGSFFEPIEDAMFKRGIQLHRVLGMGAGTLDQVAANAWEFIKAHPLYKSDQPCHLIGHSAGGLIARRIDGLANKRFESLTTIATANRGSMIAERCLHINELYPRTGRFLKLLAYDLESRREFLSALTAHEVERYLKAVPEGLSRKASVVCSSESETWSAPLRWLHKLAPLKDLDFEGDGIVEKSSQVFGEILGEVKADHLAQVGLLRNKQGLNEICDLVGEFVKRPQT